MLNNKMKLNKWKNSKESIAFWVLSVWPVGFMLKIIPPASVLNFGEYSSVFGLVIFIWLAVAAFLAALILRFFSAPKPTQKIGKDKRKMQAYVCAFIVAIGVSVSSIDTDYWPARLSISLVLGVLAYCLKRDIKGAAWGLVICSACFIFAESYFNGSIAWIWMHSLLYWASLRYVLVIKEPLESTNGSNGYGNNARWQATWKKLKGKLEFVMQFVLFGCFAAFVMGGAKGLFNPTPQSPIQIIKQEDIDKKINERLLETANKLNKSMPKIIDDETRLDRVVAGNLALAYENLFPHAAQAF